MCGVCWPGVSPLLTPQVTLGRPPPLVLVDRCTAGRGVTIEQAAPPAAARSGGDINAEPGTIAAEWATILTSITTMLHNIRI